MSLFFDVANVVKTNENILMESIAKLKTLCIFALGFKAAYLADESLKLIQRF